MKGNVLLIMGLLVSMSSASAFGFSLSDSTKVPAGKWTLSSTPAMKVDEKFYNNWSSAGNSLIQLTTTFFGNYKYTHEKFIWDNVVDLAYGYNWQDLDGDTSLHGFKSLESMRKSDDKIDLTSTFSMRMKNDWNVSASVNFKSQFGNGYTYTGAGLEQEETLVSGFMAPAYLTTALGFERKKEHWNISLSFLTGKTTFVVNDSLIKNGHNYGVLQEEADMANGIYNHVYFGLGSYVKFFYKKDITKNLNLYTRFELFYDYRKPKLLDWGTIDQQLADGNITEEQFNEMDGMGWLARRTFETDVDVEVVLNYRFNAFMSAFCSVNVKYDTDFSGMGRYGRWQVYQGAGLQIYFNWKSPQS